LIKRVRGKQRPYEDHFAEAASHLVPAHSVLAGRHGGRLGHAGIPFSGDGKRYLQLRVEAFNAPNHPQFSGYNLTSNVTNGAGQTGNAIFSNFTGLVASNNTRPAGSTSVLGTYFGEPNAAQNMRVIQLGAKFYF
jgi:hypothetical protein